MAATTSITGNGEWPGNDVAEFLRQLQAAIRRITSLPAAPYRLRK